VSGYVEIDMLAGPSEILVIADDTADPAFVAADMLSQVEHEPGRAILVTVSEPLIEKVLTELEKQLALLPLADRTKWCLEEYGLIVHSRNLEDEVLIANTIAPEHLEILTACPETLAQQIRNAGVIFVGPHTPEPVGDYIAGPSHVLPTGGTARMCSGLSVNDFLRRTSVMQWSEEKLACDKDAIISIAETEGLHAHANAVKIRFSQTPG
jgi:histidinol dehydrogenase